MRKSEDKQFIIKLCEMIKQYPQYINWNQTGKIIVISDIDQLQKSILKQYFNSSKFCTFIRQANFYLFQLNNYDFHKVNNYDFPQIEEQSTDDNKIKKPQTKRIAFINKQFFIGNENYFKLIVRKNKVNEEIKKSFKINYQIFLIQLQNKINSQEIKPQTKNFIEGLVFHNHQITQNFKKIKQQIKYISKTFCQKYNIKEDQLLISNQQEIQKTCNKLNNTINKNEKKKIVSYALNMLQKLTKQIRNLSNQSKSIENLLAKLFIQSTQKDLPSNQLQQQIHSMQAESQEYNQPHVVDIFGQKNIEQIRVYPLPSQGPGDWNFQNESEQNFFSLPQEDYDEDFQLIIRLQQQQQRNQRPKYQGLYNYNTRTSF